MKNIRKKILFLSNRGLLPVVDGHTRRSSNILKGLSKNNDIYLLFMYEKDQEIDTRIIDEYKSYCCVVDYVKSPEKSFSFEMLYRLVFSVFSALPYTIWRHYSYSFIDKIKKLINNNNIDIVHCDILPICLSVKNIKVNYATLTDHDVSYSKCLTIARGTNNLIRKAFLYYEAIKLKRLESRIFAKYDLGIVVSETDKTLLQSLCPVGKFVVIENGVDLTIFSPSCSSDIIDKKIVWIGGFNHFSNRQAITYFLEKIYPNIKKQLPDISFDIVGDGVTEELRKYQNADNGINFTGFLPDPMMVLCQGMVFVAPIVSGGGTKLKVLEAMAMGKAVVTTSLGAEGIEGENGIHFLIADNDSSFIDSVVSLMSDELLRMKLQQHAHKLIASKYSYDAIVQKLDNYYDRLLEVKSEV